MEWSFDWSSDISWRQRSFSAMTLASCVDRSWCSFFCSSRRLSIWQVTLALLFSSLSSSVTCSCATERTDTCSISCCCILSMPCEGNLLCYPSTSILSQLVHSHARPSCIELHSSVAAASCSCTEFHCSTTATTKASCTAPKKAFFSCKVQK